MESKINRKIKKMRNWAGTKKNKLFGLVFLLGFFFVNLGGGFKPICDFLGHAHVHQVNVQYLEESRKESERTFFLLSALKTELSILESTSGGIDFFIDVNVDFGKIVKAVNDLVDHAWNASIVALATLESQLVLLKVSKSVLEISISVVLFLGILFVLTSIFELKLKSHVKRQLHLFLLFAFFINIVFPISIYAANQISERLTSEMKADVHKKLIVHKVEIANHNKPTGLSMKVKSTIGLYSKLKDSIESRLEVMSSHLIRHLVVIVFDIFIFPLGCLLAVYLFFKRVLSGFDEKTVKVEALLEQ